LCCASVAEPVSQCGFHGSNRRGKVSPRNPVGTGALAKGHLGSVGSFAGLQATVRGARVLDEIVPARTLMSDMGLLAALNTLNGAVNW
jgi:hypothetical protein